LVAIDLDDTLLDSRLRISRECRVAITRVREAGVKVTLATGRMFSSALPYARQLDMNVPLITYQGAWVRNSLSGETLYYRPVPRKWARALLARVREFGYHCQTYIDDRLCMEALTEEGKAYAELAGVTPVIVDRLEDVMDQDPLKLLVINNDTGRLDELERVLLAEFGEHLYITKSKPFYLEAMHPEATKGKALEAVARYFGINRAEVMAVGDSYNDLDMLQWAGLGVAMANAREEVRRAADYVTLSNEEHGVAEALTKFILERKGS